jgi:hypothetical protein
MVIFQWNFYLDIQKVGNVSPKHCVGDSRLDPVDGRKWENPLNRCDLSAKGRLPHVYLLTKIPLIYYELINNVKTNYSTE